MGTGVTIAVVGKIATADVADTGIVVVSGSTASTSTGQAVTLTVTPTANTSTGTLTWSCAGTPAKYMPATCR
jgi:type IV pilus assembly protein PilA